MLDQRFRAISGKSKITCLALLHAFIHLPGEEGRGAAHTREAKLW